uniref:CCHC-type domain-containing protein n=1 Tax=Amphiprion ocellaris TaxID=80972 RepID=A0A3Q1C8A0_AMPOC
MCLTLILRWCRGEGLDEAKALLALVPEDVEIDVIEETIQTIKCLGRVRVRGRLFHTSLNCLLVLCECKEDVPKDNAPKEVFNQDSGESWQIVTLNETKVADDFTLKLKTLLDAEGKTMDDIQGLLSSSPRPSPSPDRPANSTESILQAVGDLLEKTRKPPAEGGYRRLRLFSGNLPVPPSEEPFDHWLEQAWLMVEESDCTDKEKRRRLMESLKGPALEIAKSVREADPEASPTEYLEALESAFGSAESGDDLYFAFRLMQQQPSEKLSDFLRRLERALAKVVQRGGFPASSKDQACLEQLLRGAVASDLMLIQLRLRERKSSPPTFLQLLSEIPEVKEETASEPSAKPANVTAVGATPKTKTPNRNRQPVDEQFCYHCGEKGHFVAKCRNPENQSKVIRKLIQTVKTIKESPSAATSPATDNNCNSWYKTHLPSVPV